MFSIQAGVDPKKLCEKVNLFVQQLFLEIIYDLSSKEDIDLFSSPELSLAKNGKVGCDPQKIIEKIPGISIRPAATPRTENNTNQRPIVVDVDAISEPIVAAKLGVANNDKMEVERTALPTPLAPHGKSAKSQRSKHKSRYPRNWTKELEDAKTVSMHYSDEDSDSGTEEYSTSELWHLNTVFATANSPDHQV